MFQLESNSRQQGMLETTPVNVYGSSMDHGYVLPKRALQRILIWGQGRISVDGVGYYPTTHLTQKLNRKMIFFNVL